MIDPHMAAYNAISSALRASYATITLFPESAPTSINYPLPCVSVQMIDNPEIARDLSNNENASRPVLQIDVYSNLETGNLAQRKAIEAIIDTTLRGMKYNRIFQNDNMPNIELTIKRSTMRYTSIAT